MHVELTDYAKKTELPTKVSELENDTKFITLAEVPVTDLTDYAKKSELPTKTSQLTNNSEYVTETELNTSLSSYAKTSDISAVPTKVSAFENDKGYLTEHQSLTNYATKDDLSQAVGSVYKVKGSVASYDNLPTTHDAGDVYNLLDTGANYVWNGTEWDKLSETVDLSDYAKKSEIPTVPSNVSAFTNDAGYLTEHQDISGKQDVITAERNAYLSSNKVLGIPFITPNETAASLAWTFDVDGITEYYDGLAVILYSPTLAGASGQTFNINGLGAKPVYYNTNTNVSSSVIPTKRMQIFVYNTTTVSTGCFVMVTSYDTNSYDRILLNGINVTADASIYGSQFVMQSANGGWNSICKTRDISKTKSCTTTGFIPDSVFYYNSSSTVTSGNSLATNTVFSAFLSFDSRYCHKLGATLEIGKFCYLVGTIADDRYFYLDTDNWFTQTVPTEEDGKVYILVGSATSITNLVFWNGGMYKFYNGRFQKYLPIIGDLLSRIEALEAKIGS